MPPDMCISGGAQVFYGGIGTILGGVIAWLANKFINYLIEDINDWKSIAQRGTGIAEDAVDVAKKRR
jgi:hypothetical protein